MIGKQVTFKHKSGQEMTGKVLGVFLYKNSTKNIQQEYLTVEVDGKKYSVNPKNIKNEITK